MNEIIKHNNTIYKWVDGGLLRGYVKSSDIPEADPYVEWTGEKMPHALWKSILSFFYWTYTDTKPSSDEAMVRIYYNESNRSWLSWAPPQKGLGMTVKTIDDHPNWVQEQEFEGYALVGTGHHHCSSKAFQSGTDHADEKLCNGLHFTVGELDKQFVSLHARAVFNGSMVEVDLEDWIDIADEYKAALAEENLAGLSPGFVSEMWTRAAAYSHQTKPAADTQFPEIWKGNYLKNYWNGNQGTIGFNGALSGTSHNHTTGYFKTEWNPATGQSERIWVDTTPKKIDARAGNGHVTSMSRVTPSELGAAAMERMMSTGVSLIEMSLIANEMVSNPRTHWRASRELTEICDILNKFGLNPRWFEKWCEEEDRVQTWVNAI